MTARHLSLIRARAAASRMAALQNELARMGVGRADEVQRLRQELKSTRAELDALYDASLRVSLGAFLPRRPNVTCYVEEHLIRSLREALARARASVEQEEENS